MQDKLEKLTAQNEILRHDLRTQEYYNVKLHEGNRFKDSYSKFAQMRSQVTQTEDMAPVAKNNQSEGAKMKKKLKMRNQAIDIISPTCITSRSASTLSSAAAIRNLNRSQTTLQCEQDRPKHPAFLMQSVQGNQSLYPLYRNDRIPLESASEHE